MVPCTFDKKLKELIKSVIFIGEQFDEVNKKLESPLLKIKHLRTDHDKIIAKNTKLANEILEIKQTL